MILLKGKVYYSLLDVAITQIYYFPNLQIRKSQLFILPIHIQSNQKVDWMGWARIPSIN